ncbi:hypothetical protein C9F11_21070 [Streptomyces sp. YIM 121038]|nr:hypothetical protein C9F11_21070 [Streptomyces sp. YIM 121038]
MGGFVITVLITGAMALLIIVDDKRRKAPPTRDSPET